MNYLVTPSVMENEKRGTLQSVPFFAPNSLEHEITVAFCDIFLYNNVRVAQKQIEKRKAG